MDEVGHTVHAVTLEQKPAGKSGEEVVEQAMAVVARGVMGELVGPEVFVIQLEYMLVIVFMVGA